ncbi:phosphoribosylformylglycinamidine synthase subunit PurS [Mechercharimyces sp. CAU 1602]|uniref:phosphoribosylformylglycinamidine synthase subunit PurS n=1 Tax=Mechercharimyces sp. CAU 1602 TaxID=2973933 RepID=UPI002162CB33|nr:phosphoribosylformylglycinamidine synthase subunit PurS [Mechercharimyces sp. CAU 1602]MCS1352019.1 phosphoribosylformylglycinamidine synthase subunit PurS [Mechercharimyces sp. CAU 1602]
MMKVTIHIRLKESVLDPQGNATKGALHSLGFTEVQGVRMGKTIEVWLDTSHRTEAEAQAQSMCEKLLANPVIEEYSFHIEEEATCVLP